MMTTLVVGPFYLGSGLGLTATQVGLVMSVGPLISIVSGVPSGHLVDAWGSRRVLVMGLLLLAAGSGLLALLPNVIGIAGYILAIGLLGRMYWAVVGNYYAKELFWLPIYQLGYWKDLWQVVKWYSFLSERPGQYIGHNPLARAAMFLFFLVPCIFMVLSGFAMYSEGLGVDSWADALFGWIIPLYGQSQDVHTWHHLGMWVILCFVILHIYFAVRDEIVGRSSMVSTMLSGHRTFKD